MVVHKKGHKNSKGEKAEWCIISHKTGKILSSHKSKTAAESHLNDMRKFKHMKESILSESSNNEIIEKLIKIIDELYKNKMIDDYGNYTEKGRDFTSKKINARFNSFVKKINGSPIYRDAPGVTNKILYFDIIQSIWTPYRYSQIYYSAWNNYFVNINSFTMEDINNLCEFYELDNDILKSDLARAAQLLDDYGDLEI